MSKAKKAGKVILEDSPKKQGSPQPKKMTGEQKMKMKKTKLGNAATKMFSQKCS